MSGTKSPQWEDVFRERGALYSRLKDEVLFALKDAVIARGIKTHSIIGRVKGIESVADKVRRKEYGDPLSEVDDIVGVRAVVLFLSDLPRLHDLLSDSFEIHEADDKVADSDPSTFGYMSIHYLATLKDHHSGPRYDDLKGIRFEIQTRTIVMDAWANVSHYLDYKGESSVPSELRKDFFALSGLFYVADQHFEIFAGRASESQERAEQELRTPVDATTPINLDTVDAYLARRYPDREHSARASISEFVEEISGIGFNDIETLATALDEGEPKFLEYESESPPEPDEHEEIVEELSSYADLGAARLSLAMANAVYDELKYHGRFQKAA